MLHLFVHTNFLALMYH